MPSTSKPIRLIVGLGNPGGSYRDTRHNTGFLALDLMARGARVSFLEQPRFHALAARASFSGGSLWLLKPQTYMNLSGEAVQPFCAYYRIEPDEVLVGHDELDLLPGVMKLKFGGGNAGHNGLKDITLRLGTPDFWRLRIGIGHPRVFCPQQEVYDWVLHAPGPEHAERIGRCAQAAAGLAERLSLGQFESVQRTLRKFASPPKEEAARPEAGEPARQASPQTAIVE